MKGSKPYWKWGLYRGGFKEDFIPKDLIIASFIRSSSIKSLDSSDKTNPICNLFAFIAYE